MLQQVYTYYHFAKEGGGGDCRSVSITSQCTEHISWLVYLFCSTHIDLPHIPILLACVHSVVSAEISFTLHHNVQNIFHGLYTFSVVHTLICLIHQYLACVHSVVSAQISFVLGLCMCMMPRAAPCQCICAHCACR